MIWKNGPAVDAGHGAVLPRKQRVKRIGAEIMLNQTTKAG
jgi:hypothetical protein